MYYTVLFLCMHKQNFTNAMLLFSLIFLSFSPQALSEKLSAQKEGGGRQ